MYILHFSSRLNLNTAHVSDYCDVCYKHVCQVLTMGAYTLSAYVID
jgi:hypothetical protein